jgi:hypothetical protein
VEDALAVRREEERVDALAHLKIARAPQEPPPPAVTPEAPKEPGEASVPSNFTVIPNIQAPRDQIWVFLLKDGFPVPYVVLTFVGKTTGKVGRQKADARGKVTYRANAEESYTILLFDEKYAHQMQDDARPGVAYRVAVGPVREDSGVVLVDAKGFNLPNIGHVKRKGSWSGSGNTTGPVFRTDDIDAMFDYGHTKNTFIHAHLGRKYVIKGDDAAYELTLHQIGDGDDYYIRYNRL